MKNLLFSILLVICASGSLFSQMFVGDVTIHITDGAVLFSTGDITNARNATITTEGTLRTLGDILNSGTATLEGDGQYTLEGDWTNSATFDAGTSTVTFEGATNSTVTSGGDAFYKVELSKTTADLLLADDMNITNDLNFVSDDNKVFLFDNDLIFGTSATVTSYDDNEYIVTGGTGQVKKTDLGTTAFVFPVGFDDSTYNPLTLVQSASGALDEFGVRVLENVLADGGSGPVLTEGVVDASWEVTEAVAGGSDLTLTAQWVETPDELPGFDRGHSGISYYDGAGWDLTNADTGAAAGADPYTRIRIGVAEVVFFAVGSEALMDYLAITPMAFLEGPYNTGTGLMNDNLRAAAPVLIPENEPYTALSNFIHVGGGETVDPAVFGPTGNDAIVDWVFIELRDKNAPATVLQTKPALIQRDGDIVDLDGVSEVRFVGIASDDYYLAVRHRNHLGVMSANTFTLSRTQTAIDFTSISTYGTNAQKDLGGGVMGMWTGDIDYTGVIDATDRSGVWNNRNLSDYRGSDATLDGITDAADRSIVWNNRNLIAQLPN